MTAQPPTLLVLAASTYQLPFIQAARDLGCRVLTADNRPSNPGHALADASFNCDTTDVAGMVSLARREAVNGVVAAATDVALDAAAAIAHTLGLPGPSPECVSQLTRKSAFRELQVKLGLPHPLHASTPEKIDFPAPWIIKPNRASGSKGIRIVDKPDELASAWATAASESVDRTALVEAFTDGSQGTIEGVVTHGRIATALITERSTAPAPWVATRSHRVPAAIPLSTAQDLYAQIERIFSALAYVEGPFDGDFLIRPDGTPVLIELTPRAGGNSLVRMLKYAVGFDMPDYVIQTALGRKVHVAPFAPRPTIVEILGVETDGQLTYDAGQAKCLMEEPGIRYLHMDYPPGTPVHCFTDGRHRVGELVASADTDKELDALLVQAHKHLALGTR